MWFTNNSYTNYIYYTITIDQIYVTTTGFEFNFRFDFRSRACFEQGVP